MQGFAQHAVAIQRVGLHGLQRGKLKSLIAIGVAAYKETLSEINGIDFTSAWNRYEYSIRRYLRRAAL